MKILISAVACGPAEGSEGGVGWQAVSRIARHHEVRVLTHRQFETSWRIARENGHVPESVKVRFLGDDKPWPDNRLIARLESWRRYLAFNRQVLAAARAWYAEETYDLAHHVTYATWRVASPLWQLPVPFVWGPIAGAAQFPRSFLPILGRQARAFERLRDLNSAMAARSRAFHECVRKSAVVIAANEETEAFLKPHRGDGPMLKLPVAFLSRETVEHFRRPPGTVRREGPLRLFAGGNMIGSKGLSLAVNALKKLKDAGIGFHYTIAGGGPEIPVVQALVARLGLQSEVSFHPGYRGADYAKALQDSDVYFLPSFREALGLTMVEAVLAGCYPLVADASMPGELVRMAGGSAVPVTDIQSTVDALFRELLEVHARLDSLPSEAEQIRGKLAAALSAEAYDSGLAEAYRIACAR